LSTANAASFTASVNVGWGWQVRAMSVKNLDACLKAAGATWADVVKTNTFVTDYQAFSQCSDVRMRYFGVASPTSTTIQIGGLAQPEAMVEIELIAVVE